MDAGRPKEGLIVRNAKCPHAPLNEELISVLNVRIIPVLI
jgi:hypothetical protein